MRGGDDGKVTWPGKVPFGQLDALFLFSSNSNSFVELFLVLVDVVDDLFTKKMNTVRHLLIPKYVVKQIKQ